MKSTCISSLSSVSHAVIIKLSTKHPCQLIIDFLSLYFRRILISYSVWTFDSNFTADTLSTQINSWMEAKLPQFFALEYLDEKEITSWKAHVCSLDDCSRKLSTNDQLLYPILRHRMNDSFPSKNTITILISLHGYWILVVSTVGN